MHYMKRLFCIFLMLSFCLLPFGCEMGTTVSPTLTEASASVPTETPVPTPTPEPTFEHVPIKTPEPTEEPTPEPTETPTPTPEPTEEPTPEPTETPVPAPTPFSIVWMSDTQNLSRHYPEVFNCMRDWIVDERESQNIVFFIHTGDVVDGISQPMWNNASIALIPILHKVPGMIVSGNHDVGYDENQALFYERPYAIMTRKEGQYYNEGECAYQIFSAGGDEFLVFGFGYNVLGTGVWDWVNSTIQEHPDAVVLFAMHYGLQEDNRYSGQAKELFNRVVKQTPNARLLLCGHFDGALLHEDWIDDDGDVETDRCFYTMMFNVQDDREGGLGYMRILTFYPEDRHIEVRTYSPWYDQWGYPDFLPEDNSFILDNAY